MKEKVQKNRGRPPLPPLEKAIRRALLARRRYLDLVEKRNGLMAFDPEDLSAVLDKQAVAEKRLEIARLAEAQRLLAKSAKDQHKGELHQKKERAYRADLNALPPLGYGFKQWQSLPPEKAKRPVGKQPMPLELQLCRAQLEWETAEKDFKAQARKAGLQNVDLAGFQATVKSAEGVGRPPLDHLGELDAKIRHYQRRIQEVKALPEEGFRQPPLGRKPIPRQKHIDGYQRRIDLLKQEITAKEAELDPADILRRRRKRLWNERFILANTSLHQLSERAKAKRLKAIEIEMEELEAQIDYL